MPTDLNNALANGDFSIEWNCVSVVHKGRSYVTGGFDATYGGQIILPAGSLPNPPAESVAIDLWPYISGSIPGVHPNSVYHAYPSTVHPDGSWTFDSPVTYPTWYDPQGGYDGGVFRRVYLAFILVGSWDLAPVTDAPSDWASLPNGDGFTGSPEASLHEEVVHLRGDTTANTSDPQALSYPVPENFKAWAPDNYGTLTRAQAPWGPSALAQYYSNLLHYVPHSVGYNRDIQMDSTAIESARVPGGTNYYRGTWKRRFGDQIVENTNVLVCPNYTHPSGLTSAASMSFDLAVAVAEMNAPDWVSIWFTAHYRTRYESYNSCQPSPPAPWSTDGFGYGISFWPSVSGQANPKFVPAAGPGDYSLISPSSGPQITDAFEHSSDINAWLAPAASQYARPGLSELAGMEYMQLLWKPEDVGNAVIQINGSFRYADITVSLNVFPLYDTGSKYLKAGDVVTLTHGYAAKNPQGTAQIIFV